jgi:uncharacterized membrane protein YjjP (DUF1212 family)
MIDFVVKSLMELGAATDYGEKSAERIAQRNGYCHCDNTGVVCRQAASGTASQKADIR